MDRQKRPLCICLAFRRVILIWLHTVFLSYVGSRDLFRQWPAEHNQHKQIFLNETFKTRCASLLVIPVIGILPLFSSSVTSHPPVSCLTPSAKAGVGCWMEPIFNSGQDVEIDRIWWEDVFGSKDFKIKSPFHRKHLHDVLLNVLYAWYRNIDIHRI